MKIKLTISYDGRDFCGWQKQKNGLSVQTVIEDAIFTLTGERVSVTGSGRTDAGVHAQGQVADFSTNSTIPPEKFAFALNSILPPTVKVVSSESVGDTFNARKSAKRKTYEYNMYQSPTELPLKEPFAVRVEQDLDMVLMQKACELLVGKHDFKCMRSTNGGAQTTEREICGLTIEKSGIDLKITVTGNGFLYNMVRIMAGTLVGVGSGKISLEDIQKALLTGDRTLCGKTMPARGLCLKSVEYDI